MLVRLTAKLAERVNDVDLSLCKEGDVIDLPERQARMLIAENWGELVRESDARYTSQTPGRAVAADRNSRRATKPQTESTRKK